ncbi:MAG: hypothetical protein U1E17_09065 [Geminicoccaceae bacterium]
MPDQQTLVAVLFHGGSPLPQGAAGALRRVRRRRFGGGRPGCSSQGQQPGTPNLILNLAPGGGLSNNN